MPTKIFISYRRDDSKWQAREIYRALVQVLPRDHVFMDVDSIPLGADFVNILEGWVNECQVLLALIGHDWADAVDRRTGQRRLDNPQDFVRIELRQALRRGISVVPVLLDGTSMPDADHLPEDMRSLVRRQAELVEHRTVDADVARLIKRLGLEPDGSPGRGVAGRMLGRGQSQTVGDFLSRWWRGRAAHAPASRPLVFPNSPPAQASAQPQATLSIPAPSLPPPGVAAPPMAPAAPRVPPVSPAASARPSAFANDDRPDRLVVAAGQILRAYNVPGVGRVAGVEVTFGTMKVGMDAVIFRDGSDVAEATIVSLQQNRVPIASASVGDWIGVIFKPDVDFVGGDEIELDSSGLQSVGEAEIVALFDVSGVGRVAGCRMRSGDLDVGSQIKVVGARTGHVRSDTIMSMMVQKEFVHRVGTGQEFGLVLEGDNSYAVGDLIRAD